MSKTVTVTITGLPKTHKTRLLAAIKGLIDNTPEFHGINYAFEERRLTKGGAVGRLIEGIHRNE